MINNKLFSSKRSLNFLTRSGSNIKEIKHGRVGVDGIIFLVVDDVKDVQEEINSYKRSTDIYNIISKLTGDQMFMYADQAAQFFDCAGLPTNYAEALQLVIDGQRSFENLPVDIKQRFDNDFNQYFATAGTETWFSKLGAGKDVESVEKVEEVKLE